MAELTPSARDRLGKLVRMLSSDKPGEVVAATEAIKRTLATEGFDIHSLADALCQPASEAKPREAETADDPARTTDWHAVACACAEREVLLSAREREFVLDMVWWTERTWPTEKQQSWLLSIFVRVRRRYG
jgi:hypothetical protein